MKTISLIVPAYNEGENLSATIKSIKNSMKGLFMDYEIFIFDDCSTDKTGLIADELSEKDKKIKVIHNSQNMGLGYGHSEGVKLANKEYVMLVPGNNLVMQKSVRAIMECAGKADVILLYHNPDTREFYRRFVSKSFVKIFNLLIGLNVKYCNGPVLYKTNIVKNVKSFSYSIAYQAELLAKILNSGASFMEVGMTLKKRDYGKSKVFKVKNLMSVFKTILCLFFDVRIKNRKIYNKKPVRVAN